MPTVQHPAFPEITHEVDDDKLAAHLTQGWLLLENERIDVDTILDSLPDEYSDPGEDPWGGANLAEPVDSGSEKVIKTRSRTRRKQ